MSTRRCKFRTLCTRLRPVEVLFCKERLKSELRNILQNSPLVPRVSPLRKEYGDFNYLKALPMLEKYLGTDFEKWPLALTRAKTNLWQHAISAMGIAAAYLEDCLIAKQVVTTAEYEIFDLDTSLLFTMTLDSQALQHLEVLEVAGRAKNVHEGSLLHYIDRTLTPFGKRELKRWLCAPLYDIGDINRRLDAVEDLLRNKEVLGLLRERLRNVGRSPET